MKKFFAMALVAAAFCGWILEGRGWSQQAAPPNPGAQPYPPSPIVVAQPVFDPASRTTKYHVEEWNTVYGAARTEIDQLVKQLGEAEDSTKKSEITKQLESEVAKFFDSDMEQRETDLKNLEERVKKLNAQLDRRRKAKDDIIQLQVKVLINEAEGLGFGRPSTHTGQLPRATVRSSGVGAPSLPTVPAPARR
jgi:hypothetical protein